MVLRFEGLIVLNVFIGFRIPKGDDFLKVIGFRVFGSCGFQVLVSSSLEVLGF